MKNIERLEMKIKQIQGDIIHLEDGSDKNMTDIK